MLTGLFNRRGYGLHFEDFFKDDLDIGENEDEEVSLHSHPINKIKIKNPTAFHNEVGIINKSCQILNPIC
jgi:hypothetical protein